MRRREFIKVLAGFSVAWPIAVPAQEPGRTYRIGFLLPAARNSPAIMAFFDELRANGFVEGQNLVVTPGGFEVRNEQELLPNLTKIAILVRESSPTARPHSGIPAHDAEFTARRVQIAELALRNQLPTVSGLREMVEAGGFMAYGASFGELYRRAAGQVRKILQGVSCCATRR
jgi:hypothetical protein